MRRTTFMKGALGLSAVAALFAALAVHAQSTGNQTSTSTGSQTGSQAGTQSGTQSGSASGQSATGQAGQQASGQTSTAQSATGAGQASGQTSSGTGSATQLTRSDRKMIMDMAMANMAEIEAARTAQTKSQNDQVKNFAQQMIDDHTRALNEVQQVAQAKGVTLPTQLDRAHRAKADKLAAMSGDAFDRTYMAQAGVSDHKKTHAQLRQVQAKAKDPEIKALATRTLPMVDQHLNSAQQVHKSTAQGSSRTQGTTQSGDRGDKADKTDRMDKTDKMDRTDKSPQQQQGQ